MVKFYAREALTKKREELGATQSEMVGLICAGGKYTFKRAYYGHVEEGIRGIEPDLALHIARILKADVNEVFESRTEEGVKKSGSE